MNLPAESQARIDGCVAKLKKWLPLLRQVRAQMPNQAGLDEQVEAMDTALWMASAVIPMLLSEPKVAASEEVMAIRLLMIEMAEALGGSIAVCRGVVECERAGRRPHSGHRVGVELQLEAVERLLAKIGVRSPEAPR